MADNSFSVPFTFYPQLRPIPLEIWDKYFSGLDEQASLLGRPIGVEITWKQELLDQVPSLPSSVEKVYMVPYATEIMRSIGDVPSLKTPLVVMKDSFTEAFETASREAEEYLKAFRPKDQMRYDFTVENGHVWVYTIVDEEGGFFYVEDHEGLPNGWNVCICNAGIAVGRFPKNMELNQALKNKNRVHLLHWHEAEITRMKDGTKVEIEIPSLPEPDYDENGKIKTKDAIFRDIISNYMAGNLLIPMELSKGSSKELPEEVSKAAEFLSNCFRQLSSLMKTDESEKVLAEEEEACISEGALLENEETRVPETATVEDNGETAPSEPALTGEQLSKAGIQVAEETTSDMHITAAEEREKKRLAMEESLKMDCSKEEVWNHFLQAAQRWGVPANDLPDPQSYLARANTPPVPAKSGYLDAKDFAGKIVDILMDVIGTAGARLEEFYRDPEKPLGPTDRRRFKDMVIYLIAGLNCGSGETSAVAYKAKAKRGCIDAESVRRIRHALTPAIFEFIFLEFTRRLRTSPDLKPLFRTMFGFLIYSVDGSDVNLPKNKADTETLCTNGKGRKPFNQIHLNAIYDCLNGFYVACTFRGTKKTGVGERNALYELLKELTGEEKEQCLLLADRGYDGHETVARLQKEGVNFLFRVKANNSNGFLSTFQSLKTLKEDTFYGELHYTIGKSAKQILPEDGTAHIVRKSFDFLNEGEVIHVHLRVLQFRLISGELEALITNVPIWKLSPFQMYYIYSRRWGIEDSFRNLKYKISLSQLHSWMKDYVRQELWAKLVTFNFVSFIANHTKVPETKRLKPRKYEYKIRISNAVVLCRNLLVGAITVKSFAREIVLLPVPIRPNRSYGRDVKPKSAVPFQCRGTGM